MRLHENSFPYISRTQSHRSLSVSLSLVVFPSPLSKCPRPFPIPTGDPQNHIHISDILQTKQVVCISRENTFVAVIKKNRP